MANYAARRRTNAIFLGLSVGAAGLGLLALVFILAALLYNGIAGLTPAVFTEMTPPPGSAGGLLNAIYGSFVMTLIGLLIGAPIGLLAGTYMAEYGRYSRLSLVVRFINDILLSAPSIIIGLFVSELLVVPFGHFSGYAGSVALAILVIPVVARTTEDMLLLVPNPLREAASAMGLPRAYMIMRVAYKAARAGIITGMLLAFARISGETAPLPLHSPEQPVLEHRPVTAHRQPAGGNLPVRPQPLQGMAATGLDRRPDHHGHRPAAQHRGARHRIIEDCKMSAVEQVRAEPALQGLGP